MTIFGIVWFVLIVYCLIKKDIKYISFLTIFSMVFQSTNVINFRGIGVGPQVITCSVFIVVNILKTKKLIIRKPTLLEITMYLLFAIVTISSLFNNSFFDQLLRIAQLLIYIVTFYFMIGLHNVLDKKFIHNTIKIITIFLLLIGILQILITSNVIPRISLVSELFYNDHSISVYYWQNNYNRIFSTFMEPSYFACFLVGTLFYFLSVYKDDKKEFVLILFIIIELLLTRSTTAYVATVICGILFVILSDNIKIKRIIIPLAIILLLIMFIFFKDMLNSVIFEKAESGSARVRNSWNMQSIKSFNESMLIGVGYKNSRGSSIILNILGELGIAGLLSYLIFNLQIFLPLFKNSIYKYKLNSAFRFSILAVFIAQAIACPDLDLCVYWLFVFLFGISSTYISKRNCDYETIKN